MTLPCQPTVVMRLGTGAGFGIPLILGDPSTGILGTGVLSSANAEFVNLTDEVQRISINHGRDRQFEQYLPGTATIQFLDFTGDWNPANTAGAYYGKIKPMVLVRVETEYQSTGYFLFTGYVSSWDYQWADQAADYAIVTIQCVDGFRMLQLANIDNVAGAANKDLPGERINQILDAVGWPSTLRNIDLGDTELENDPGGFRPALQAIQIVEQSDLGAFFIVAVDGHDHSVLRSEARRQNHTIVISMCHDHASDQPRRDPPRCCPGVNLIALLVLETDIHGFRKVLTQEVGGPRLECLAILHHRFDGVGVDSTGKAFVGSLFPLDDWHRHIVHGEIFIDIQHLQGLVDRFFRARMHCVSLLPKELSGPEEQSRSHLPAHHICPLVDQDG